MIGLFIVVKIGVRESLLTVNTKVWIICEETLFHHHHSTIHLLITNPLHWNPF